MVPAPSAAESQAYAYAASPRRILVVDDNEDAANSLAMLLQLDGHQVSTAYSGAEALNIAEQTTPEVILLDIGLPKMDGYEVARRLRASLSTSSVRLIALTGYGQPEDIARALAAGFNGHLRKPVDLQQLQRMLSDDSDAAAVGT